MIDCLITSVKTHPNHKFLQAILEFLQFFENWENLENKIPVSKSTSIGLKVTLRATLEILDMLKNECGYKYLMIIRGNDYPDPKMFAQVYRLASTFSLIRPPKGSNVSGDNLLKNLMKPDEVLSSSNQERESWLRKIDAILEDTEPQVEGSSLDEDHDYNEAVTSDVVQSYIAGYITRKMQKNVKCSDCLTTLRMSAVDGQQLQRNDVINKMSRFGGLLYASSELFELTKQLEKCILRAVSKALTNVETISQIYHELKKVNLINVGCFQHERELTVKIIDVYIVMRAHFLAKSENKRYDAAKTKTKMNRKNAKLYS
ncbi:Protein of unknown function [Cotesia congregata]|uniref:Uncharacterized protein n=1 Tax=Cotesia congregata TaxID=51543 RepID=A0A8J2MKY0_COTCN|nr:Protein of unknown function [Cotesia congregata]